MNKKKYTGKTKEEAISQAQEEYKLKESDLIITEIEEKKALFNKKVEIEVISKQEVNEEIKKYLLNIVKHMGIEDAKIETKVRENMPIFNIVTEVTILIGKGGRTIDALQVVANQMVLSNINNQYRFLIDVNEYKQQKNKRLEKMAKYTAKEVARTGVSVNLDPMNSYNRRIIHSTLSDSKDVKTESEGTEPNRYVVIKPKETK